MSCRNCRYSLSDLFILLVFEYFRKDYPDIFLILIWEFLSSSLDIFIKLSDLDALCNLSECFFIQIFENFKVLGTLLYLRKALWNTTRTGINLPYVRLSCQFNRFRCTVLYSTIAGVWSIYCIVLYCHVQFKYNWPVHSPVRSNSSRPAGTGPLFTIIKHQF